MPRGKKETIGKCQIVLPGIDEQRKIVNQMTAYDKEIDDLKSRMSETDANKQAILDKY